MKTLLTILLLLTTLFAATAAEPFIKTINNAGAGGRLRIQATTDNGWAVFSLDSFKLYKFNSCGTLEWSKKYQVPPTTWNSNDFLRTLSGGFAFMTRVLNGAAYSTLITNLDANGNVLWSKLIGETYYDHFPYTMNEDAQGNLLVYANVAHHSVSDYYNMIFKVSAAGNVLWTKLYDHGGTWGYSIATSDNGMLARTGSTFIKTDNNGNVQWTSAFYAASTYEYLAPVEVSDGYIFTTISTPGSTANFHKMDKQGHTLWSGYKRTNVPGQPPVLRKKSNGNFTCAFLRSVIEFDKDLTVVAQRSLDNGLGLYGNDICFLNDGTPVLTGVGNGGEFFVSKLDAQYHTTCDEPAAAVTVSTSPVIQSALATQVILLTLNIIDITLIVENVTCSQTILCRLPKQLDLGADTLVCTGSSFVLQNQSGDVFDRYFWSNGDTTPSINVQQSGTYHLLVTNDCGEDSLSDDITVSLSPIVPVDLGMQLTFCEDSSLQLSAPACDSCLYEWSNGSTEQTIVVSVQGQYWLHVTNENGCLSADTVQVSEGKCDCNVFLPSAFTPNHDGRNELFQPVYYCDVQEYNLKIFNRWGQLIYEADQLTDGWNGTHHNSPVPSGVYPYILSYTPLLNGKPDDPRIKNGTVVLVQ